MSVETTAPITPVQTMPVALAAVVLAHTNAVQAIRDDALAAVLSLWALLRLPTLEAQWPDIGERMFVVLATAQRAVAALADQYVADVLRAFGLPDDPARPVVIPDAFTGASDGRDLESLLLQSLIRVRVNIAAGEDPRRAMDSGAALLTMITSTQVMDSARIADQVAIATVDPQQLATDEEFRRIIERLGPLKDTKQSRLSRRFGYVRVLNPPSCGRCAILAGRFYRWSAGFQRHPMCFPAGTVVSGPASLRATRRWYDGELVSIRTQSGKHLSTTANHPVLTHRGWIPAHLLREGDEVLGSTDGQSAHALVVPDEHQVPARIEDLWTAGEMGALRRVPSTAEDFHGDGLGGEVDVVPTNRHLGTNMQTAPTELGGKPALGRRVVAPAGLSREGSSNERLLVAIGASQGGIGRGGLTASLFGGHGSSAHESGFAGSARFHAGLEQAFSDRAPTHAQALRDGVLALAREVGRDDRGAVVGRPVIAGPRWDAPAGPLTMESAGAYASRGVDLAQRLAPQVVGDRVVELSSRQWSGHVYNLTSVEGWYEANGLIVSNCDCQHIPMFVAAADGIVVDPQAYFDSLSIADQNAYFGVANASAIRDGADIGRVVGATGRRNNTYVAGGKKYTTESTTKRGFYGRDPLTRGTPRMTPEQIYKDAGDDRILALSLLERYGYIQT